jgi:hypothetical protein
MSALAKVTAEVDSASNALEDTIRRIERRHREDAIWFNSGLHDQNGYVAMAHKDRGALLERLRPLTLARAEAAANPTFEAVSIPKAAYDWLMGMGPDDRGHQFGEQPDGGGVALTGKFWWRRTFNRMCGLGPATISDSAKLYDQEGRN